MLALKTAKELVDKAVETGDIYCAAAVYGIGNREQRMVLEGIMFGKRRDALALARWEHTPADVLNALCRLAVGDTAVAVRLDKNHNTPAQAIAQLYDAEKIKVKRNASFTVLIAQHQHTPIKVFEAIVKFVDDIESLKAVSKNPAANSQVLSILLGRTVDNPMNAVIVKNIAANPSASADLLTVIYAKGDAYVRTAVLAHENCSLVLIESAINDVASAPIELQRQLAKYNRLNIDVLTSLAASQDKAVRCGVAANLTLPKMLVKQLLNDESHVVRRAIAARADLTASSIERLMNDQDHWVRQWLARNLIISCKVLKKLSVDPQADVRRAVARNSRCSAELLSVLAKDEDAWVRSAVAYQKNSPKHLMEAMADDADIDVLSGVANNPHTPQRILQKLITSPKADIRRGVILNRKATRKTLLPLLEDAYYLHRLMLVGSAVLMDRDKWQLCDDPDFQVRFTAYQYFAKKFTKEICND